MRRFLNNVGEERPDAKTRTQKGSKTMQITKRYGTNVPKTQAEKSVIYVRSKSPFQHITDMLPMFQPIMDKKKKYFL